MPKTRGYGKPILFQAWSVQRILPGIKTQTRRVVKPQPETRYGEHGIDLIYKGDNWGDNLSEACPYGLIGYYLWVREVWYSVIETDHVKPSEMSHGPNDEQHWGYVAGAFNRWSGKMGEPGKPQWAGRTRSSIHMPRWASRIDLEIEDVRVERLKDISMLDLAAEGIEVPSIPVRGPGTTTIEDWQRALMRSEFMRIWDDINAKPRPVKRSGEVVGWVSYPWSISTFLGRFGDKVLQFKEGNKEGKWFYRPGWPKRPVVEEEFLPLAIYDNPWVWVLEFCREVERCLARE